MHYLPGLAGLALSCIICWNGFAATETSGPQALANRALAESTEPVKPGVPGNSPFWNKHARRFIFAPAFEFGTAPDADIYRFDVVSEDTGTTYVFTCDHSHAALSSIWSTLPVGFYNVIVTARTSDDEVIGPVGSRRFYRAAPFAGPYHEPPVLSYDDSAAKALKILLQKDYVQYWLTHHQPHPDYGYYRYPAKIFSALVVGAVTQARLEPQNADHYTSLATVIADYMTSISYPQGHAWAYHTPTYHGPRIGKNKNSHMQLDNYLSIMGADSGNAFLDVYDLTKEPRYLDAARRIADTYKNTQLDNGTWYLYSNTKTGKPTAENLAIPTAVVNFYDRLESQYNIRSFTESKDKALQWILANPAKTFNWQGQFEDVKAHPPYFNQSREQACDLAIYLFKNKQDLNLARDLVRFAEDQFVIWEKAMPLVVKQRDNNPGWNSKNWMTPSVHEQYVFWMPVMRSAGIMLETFRQAHAATGDPLYLAKARSIANSITKVQEANQGDYVTMFIDTPWNYWLNSVVYPAKYMMTFQDYLNAVESM